jgi:hypothetical protein
MPEPIMLSCIIMNCNELRYDVFSKVSLIVFGSCKRVYPNTHCSGICKSKGSQWVLSDARGRLDVILEQGVGPMKTFPFVLKPRFS